LAGPPLDALLAGGTDVDTIARAAPDVDVMPVTDAKPYFFDFEPGLPRTLRPLLWALLALSAVTVALLVVRPPPRTAVPAYGGPVLAATLGVGFMMLEIAALHATRPVLGHPTMALAVTLAAMLVGAGLGSGLLGARVAPGVRPALLAAGVATAATAAAMTAWWLLFPHLSDAIVAAEPPLRSAWVALSLVVPAALMGVAFPLVLRVLGRGGAGGSGRQAQATARPAETAVAVAWTVNGVASVVGAVAATAVASTWGTPAVAACGVVAYLAAFVVLIRLQRAITVP